MISNYEVAQRNSTFHRVMGNIGGIGKDNCSNPYTNLSTLISMCHIYHHCSKHKNASSDDKCGTEILMLKTKYARISLERTCNNDVIPDIIHDKIYAKRILISEFITTASNNFFVVAITPYCNDFVVIAMNFSVVIDLFSCSVMCLNNVKYRHVNP